MSKRTKSHIKDLGLLDSITKKHVAYGIFYIAAAFLFISISTTNANAQFTCDPPCERDQVCNDFGLCVMAPTGECNTDMDCTPPETCFLGNCIVLPDEGECELNSDCGLGEVCIANMCIGGPGGPDCDDNNPCTSDTVGIQCNPLCLPGQNCCSQFCIHENTNEGGLCDDGDACTTGSACSSGSCTGGAPVVCDDGLFCNGLEACDSDMGGCFTVTEVILDDGVACTDDSCDEVNDIVLNIPNNANCDNGAFCDGSETCDASTGCLAGTPPNTNDGVACTDDSCDEVNDIVLNIPNNANCDNGLFCDGTEVCIATLGCEGGPPPNTDDGVACTDDSCDEANDVVINEINDSLCDNGLFCDGEETCDAALDCQAATNPPTGEVCGENPEGICIDLACVFDGSITIAKMADPNDGTDFLFGCTDSDGLACGSIGDDSGMFELDDEPVDTDGVPGSETFTEVLAGVYFVQEVLPPGWQSVDIVCENDDDDGTVIDMAMAEAFIDLDPGESITCTFFNFDPPVEIEFNEDAGYLVANDNNSLYVTGATPNRKVVLIWGPREGIFTVGGNLCSGLELGIRPPKILAAFKADGDGMINTLAYVPFMDFALAYVQAADTGNCTAGDVLGLPVLNE